MVCMFNVGAWYFTLWVDTNANQCRSICNPQISAIDLIDIAHRILDLQLILITEFCILRMNSL